MDVQLVGHHEDLATQRHSDQLLISDEDEFEVTGKLTILAGGYKPDWWEPFKCLREAEPDVSCFNTAGGPVARKAFQNSALVVAQLLKSTLWDGIAAGLIAAAGGYVIRLGESAEPLPAEHVYEWFDNFGYVRNPEDVAKLKK